MNLPPSHQEQYDWYEAWREHIRRFPWQWFATFTFKPDTYYFTALERFKEWRCSLLDDEKMRVGASLMSSHKRGNLHFHVLLLGRNRHGKTLFDCYPRRWESSWRDAYKTSVRINIVEDRYKVCNYVALHFLGFKSDRAQTEPFDIKLLNDVVEPQHDGLDDLYRL